MKKIFALLLSFVMISFSLASCVTTPDGNALDTEDTDISSDTRENDVKEDPVYTIDGVDLREYSIVVRSDFTNLETDLVYDIQQWIFELIGEKLPLRYDTTPERQYEIVIGNTSRGVSMEYAAQLDDQGYLIERTSDGKIVIIYDGNENAVKIAKKHFRAILIGGSVSVLYESPFIVSAIGRLRDPCILEVDGVYYAYGTGWVCFKNTSGRLGGEWEPLGVVVDIPEDAETNYWAPEVHEYNGSYYMFTTYKSKASGHRGCTVMRSQSPEGPFVEITDGHITPADWDSIDGTFYVDESGQPWMVFVHEWTSTDDGVGRMAAAKLSADLSEFISEPVELFRADDPEWSKSVVTDGCWIYRCTTGELLMLWSTGDEYGYCVGIARSDNGRLDGNWTHDTERLYSKSMTGEYDGGHGMLFTALDGKIYLSIHSPNSSSAGREETPVFIAVKEENGTLVWDN